jgi:hypothetical protein
MVGEKGVRQRKGMKAWAKRISERDPERPAARVTARATAKRATAKRATAKRAIAARATGEKAMVGTATAPPSARARPIGLQTSRAGLLRRLAREPVISRSVGLVR